LPEYLLLLIPLLLLAFLLLYLVHDVPSFSPAAVDPSVANPLLVRDAIGKSAVAGVPSVAKTPLLIEPLIMLPVMSAVSGDPSVADTNAVDSVLAAVACLRCS
jgi:hypothetical protein